MVFSVNTQLRKEKKQNRNYQLNMTLTGGFIMNEELLRLTPKRFLCPYCGEWHPWDEHSLEFHDASCYSAKLEYKHYEMNTLPISFYFSDGYFYYFVPSVCICMDNLRGKIAIEDMVESSSVPRVSISIPITSDDRLGKYACCSDCIATNTCIRCKQGDEGDGHHITIPFGFEFEESEYFAIVKRKVESKSETSTKIKKEDNMMKNVTTIWEQLYKHSPEENINIAKEWAAKYRPTLKWAVPVVTIYAAYRILNSKDSKFNIENIAAFSQKNLGFTLDSLKDKKALKQLMVLGGMSAGAYTAIKTVSTIYSNNNPKDISVEQVEDCMDKLDGARKSFGWIQPKTETLLPVAVSVIVIYVMTQKPAWFETLKAKTSLLAGNLSCRAEVYLDMLKLFVADKLKLDLENEEEMQKVKKFAFLAAIVGVSVALYGKTVISAKADEKDKTSSITIQMQNFVQQVIGIMKKLMPTAFAGATAWLVSKHILLSEDDLFGASLFAEEEEATDSSEESDHLDTSDESDFNEE